jgi:DNA-directed RNA polymerase II subunit RPB11
MTNIPDRLASVMFPEGPRVTSVADGKMANAATFTFLREDHTLGNMLRMCVAPAPPIGAATLARSHALAPSARQHRPHTRAHSCHAGALA